MKTIEIILRKAIVVFLLFLVQTSYSQHSIFENQLLIEYLDSLDKFDHKLLTDTILVKLDIDKKFNNVKIKKFLFNSEYEEFKYIIKSKNHYLVPNIEIIMNSDSTFQVNIELIDNYRVRRLFHFKHPFSIIT